MSQGSWGQGKGSPVDPQTTIINDGGVTAVTAGCALLAVLMGCGAPCMMNVNETQLESSQTHAQGCELDRRYLKIEFYTLNPLLPSRC